MIRKILAAVMGLALVVSVAVAISSTPSNKAAGRVQPAAAMTMESDGGPSCCATAKPTAAESCPVTTE